MSIAILPAHAQSYNILTQGFEDWYMPPIGWSTQIGTGYYEWWLTDYQWDMGVSPHSGSVMVYFDCYWAEEGWDAYLISPAIDLSLAGTCTVSFWLYRDATEWAQEYEDELEVYVNTSASPSGATKIGEVHRATNLSPAAAASGWTQYSFQINTNEFSGTGNYILFRAVGMRGNDLLMDDISIDATPLKPDAGIDEIIVTGGTFRESVQTLSAVVKNFGRMDLNHAEVHWSVSLNHTVLKPEEVLYWDGLLEPNKKDTITLGDFNFTYPPGTTSFSPFEVKAYTVYPNYDDEDNNPDNNLMIRGISPITEDAGAEIITRPAGGFIPGLQEVWARIRNYAPRPLKKLRINWSVDGVDKVPADWTGNLGFNQSEEINIGVHYFTFKQPIGAYLIHAETSMPNGFNDEFPDNDAVDTYIAPSLTPGTYYIGGSNYHFRTIAEAASYLNVGGVKGNGALNFVVRNGNYPDRVLVGDFVHQDNTIIFKSETGNPGDVTISPANEDDEDYLWKIDGADNIQIKSMTFNQDVFSGRHCIMLANGSNNISLNNLVMNGISGAPMDYDYALVYSVNNAGGGFNITNCSFNEGSAGIYEGTPATKSMIKVSKCEFYQQSWSGIYIEYSNGAQIMDNTFRGSSSEPMSYGIRLLNGGTVRNNTLYGLHGTLADPDEAAISIINFEQLSEPSVIDNNRITAISDMNGIFILSLAGSTLSNNIISVSSGSGINLGCVRAIYAGDNSRPFGFTGNRIDANGLLPFFIVGSTMNMYRNIINLNSGDNPLADIINSGGIMADNMLNCNGGKGFLLTNPTGMKMYYNTIVNNSADAPAFGLITGNLEMKRNLIINNGGGIALSAAYLLPGALISDENDLFSTGLYLAELDAARLAGMNEWRTASSQDALSASVNVGFMSQNDLHLVKFNEGTFVNYPLDLPEGIDDEVQAYDIDNDLRKLYFYGADNIQPKVSINRQPDQVVACEGAPDKQLYVIAEVSYGGTAYYQWEKDGIPIDGAIYPILNFNDLQLSADGVYRVKVWGNGGAESVWSDYALVYVLKPTSITKQPKAACLQAGRNASFEVGTHVYVDLPVDYNPTFQWYRGSMPLMDNERIAGTNSSILTIRDIQPGDYADDYRVVVNGRCGSAISDNFSISPPPPVDIQSQPQGLQICEGGIAMFYISASVEGGAKLNYRWLFDGKELNDDANISGSETCLLKITGVKPSDEGDYRASVICPASGMSATSAPAALDVMEIPAVSRQPAPSYNIASGQPLSIETEGAGEGLITYQWYKDNNVLMGSNSSTLSYPVVTSNDAGTYYCMISNECGSVITGSCVVTVSYMVKPNSVDLVETNGYVLYGLNPNPAPGISEIEYYLPVDCEVRLTVTDAAGREAGVIAGVYMEAGRHSCMLDAEALRLSSGIYYILLKANDVTLVIKAGIVR